MDLPDLATNLRLEPDLGLRRHPAGVLEGAADPFEEQVGVVGLGDIVVRAHVQAPHDIVHVAHGRQEDDGQGVQVGVGAQAVTELEAIHHRHGDVADHQIGAQGPRQAQPLGPVVSQADLITRLDQDPAQHLRLDTAVFDDQDVGHGSGWWLSQGAGGQAGNLAPTR